VSHHSPAGRRVVTIAIVAMSALLGLSTPAVAVTPGPANPPTRAASVPPSLVPAAVDLKQDCAAHSAAAGTLRGWARSRFEQCHHYFRHINLNRVTGEHLGYIEFDLWILAFAYDGSRRVDYVTSVENVKQTTTMVDALTFLTVEYLSCTGTNITCTSPQRRESTIAGWFAQPTMSVITVTSPNGTGAAPYGLVNFAAQVNILAEYRDGNTIPFAELIASNSVDNVPLDTLHLTGDGIDQEARHVDDALHHPERTFPSWVGKNVPGVSRPLHRLMNQTRIDANHRASVAVCEDVWGVGYASGGLDCDEYPFKSTYEGSKVSTTPTTDNCGGVVPITSDWHGSARVIDAAQNQVGGTRLASFYGANRILDCDAFTIGTTP
jgi:hypothetical protein